MRYTEQHLASIVRNRPNKTAKGMTRTFNRHTRGHSEEAATLSVRGTLDRLNGLRFYTKFAQTNPTPCPCCGQLLPKKFILNDAGRRKLRLLRTYGGKGL